MVLKITNSGSCLIPISEILPKYLLSVAFLVFSFTSSFAQFELKIISEQPLSFFENYLSKKKNIRVQEARTISEKLIQDLRDIGYLTASLDSLIMPDTLTSAGVTPAFIAKIYVGAKYDRIRLFVGNIEKGILEQVGFQREKFKNKGVNLLKINKLKSEILTVYENSGYPFAQIFLDSIIFEDEGISGVLNAEKGDLIYFMKPKIMGDAGISDRYLIRYLDIVPREVYDRSKILKIPNRLRELPFLEEKEPAQINFHYDRAVIKLNLQKKKASRFDFIIGVLPNNLEFNRPVITGSFLAEMHNQFGKGERIFAEFEQLRPQTREINLAFNYPYVFDSSLGGDFSFGLYKRDSISLDVSFELGIRYLLRGNDYFKGFYRGFVSNLLSVNELQLRSQKKLPERLDINRSEVGIEFRQQKLDYRFNPRKGWETKMTLSGGIKSVKKNSLVLELSDEQFDFESLYDSLELQTFQGRAEVSFAGYFPTAPGQTFKAALTGVHIFSSTPTFQNEQYRIGGNRLLRGFDEESVFVTDFVITTAEYRLLTGQNSFLFTFGDIAWIHDKTFETDSDDFLYGFGAGITFDTPAGIFGLSYALGSRFGNPIDYRAGKIHFGYLSLF